MTHDPREALEIVQQMIRGKPMSAWITDTRTMKSLGDVVQEALTASPGEQEPVAWRYELAGCRVWENCKPVGWSDWEWRISETKPNAGEAMRNVTPLYLSPPPAAGWDEKLVRDLADAYDKVKLWPENRIDGGVPEGFNDVFGDFLELRNLVPEAVKALRREAPAPEGVVSVELLNIERATGDRLRSENDKLRATIASLSPSTSRPDAGDGVREQLAEALAENKALRAANTQLVLAERDRIEAALSTPPAAAESNASVEARLREALKLLISDIEDYERVNNLAPSPGKNDCWQLVTRAKEALSAAGDEEKKSEGAPAREPGMGWELSDETKARLAEIDDNLRNAAINASNIVAGNPSSPTAERREIDPKVLLLLQMVERAKGEIDASEHDNSLLNFFCDDRGRETDTYNLAIDAGYLRSSFNDLFETSRAYLTDAGRGILAALDGGAGE